MPATTAGGLPYPLPTEQAKDGADAIKNLANALELRTAGAMIQSGTAVVSLNVNGDAQFNYPTAFKAGTKPAALLQVSDPLSSIWVAPNYAASTNVACAFRCTTQQAANPPVSPGVGPWRVSWIAIGVA